jgi:hypothetical protein
MLNSKMYCASDTTGEKIKSSCKGTQKDGNNVNYQKFHNILFNKYIINKHNDQVLDKGFRYVAGYMISYEQNKRSILCISRSGLVSEAGTDRAILYIIATASPARWLGPGARHRTGRCYCSQDSPGAPVARYALGSMTQARQSRPVSTATRGNPWPIMAAKLCTGSVLACSGCGPSRVSTGRDLGARR